MQDNSDPKNSWEKSDSYSSNISPFVVAGSRMSDDDLLDARLAESADNSEVAGVESVGHSSLSSIASRSFGSGSPRFVSGEPSFGSGSPSVGSGEPSFGSGSPSGSVESGNPLIEIHRFTWVGRCREESIASRTHFANLLSHCNVDTLPCEVRRSTFVGVPVILLTNGRTKVELTVALDTVVSTHITNLYLKLFLHPLSAMKRLLSEADKNAFIDRTVQPKPAPTLRGACIGIPDITNFQMLEYPRNVDREFVWGIQFCLPPTVIGSDLEKLLAYVFAV